jgi:hypothetical protein
VYGGYCMVLDSFILPLFSSVYYLCCLDAHTLQVQQRNSLDRVMRQDVYKKSFARVLNDDWKLLFDSL